MVYVLVIGSILAWNIHHDKQEIEDTLLPQLNNFSLLLTGMGTINKDNAAKANRVLEQISNIHVDEKRAAEIKFKRLANSHKYVLSEDGNYATGVNGSFLGFSDPNENGFVNHRSRLFMLDKFWASYARIPLILDYFTVSYRYQYAYFSHFSEDYSASELTKLTRLEPSIFRHDFNDSINDTLKEKGFFFTPPYPSFLSGDLVVSAVSPIMNAGKHIGDMGATITLDDLSSLLSMPANLNDFVTTELHYSYSPDSILLKQGAYSWWEGYQYEYKISDIGNAIVTVDLAYFIKANLWLFLFLLLAVIVIHFHINFLQKEKFENQILRQELYRDTLTGIYNRRVVEDYAYDEAKEQIKRGHKASMIALDADKFKMINDQYGHLKGDKAIQYIAMCMKDCARPNDYSIRMGGDEFLIILNDASLERAKLIARRIELCIYRKSLLNLGFVCAVTTAYTDLRKNEEFNDAYKRVDELLYKNKQKKKEREKLGQKLAYQ